jgi:hypothetical protein
VIREFLPPDVLMILRALLPTTRKELMNSSASVSDLRFLDVGSLVDQQQIQMVLGKMGTPDPVVNWFFTILQERQRECSILEQKLREAESQFPEE